MPVTEVSNQMVHIEGQLHRQSMLGTVNLVENPMSGEVSRAGESPTFVFAKWTCQTAFKISMCIAIDGWNSQLWSLLLFAVNQWRDPYLAIGLRVSDC